MHLRQTLLLVFSLNVVHIHGSKPSNYHISSRDSQMNSSHAVGPNERRVIYCYDPRAPFATPAYEEPCLSSIDDLIIRDGESTFTERQAFYFGRRKYPAVHQTPDTWVGERRTPNPCKVKLTAVLKGHDREAKDVFTLEDVSTVARRILDECIKARPGTNVGGEGKVGNQRGFYVILTGFGASDSEMDNSTALQQMEAIPNLSLPSQHTSIDGNTETE